VADVASSERNTFSFSMTMAIKITKSPQAREVAALRAKFLRRKFIHVC